MRTTLKIDDDVLNAARNLAARQHKSMGDVISALVRQALRRELPAGGVRNGGAVVAEEARRGAGYP